MCQYYFQRLLWEAVVLLRDGRGLHYQSLLEQHPLLNVLYNFDPAHSKTGWNPNAFSGIEGLAILTFAVGAFFCSNALAPGRLLAKKVCLVSSAILYGGVIVLWLIFGINGADYTDSIRWPVRDNRIRAFRGSIAASLSWTGRWRHDPTETFDPFHCVVVWVDSDLRHDNRNPPRVADLPVRWVGFLGNPQLGPRNDSDVAAVILVRDDATIVEEARYSSSGKDPARYRVQSVKHSYTVRFYDRSSANIVDGKNFTGGDPRELPKYIEENKIDNVEGKDVDIKDIETWILGRLGNPKLTRPGFLLRD